MNLLNLFFLTRLRINHLVSPEVKQRVWQAMLGLGKIVGESLFKLFLGLLLKELVRDVLLNLIKDFMM
jgi:hypothetical protein